jgi:hypothetical protein
MTKNRSLWLNSPINWHNVRAGWIQSDPNWFLKLPTLNRECTCGSCDYCKEYDRETEEFMKAVSDI